MIIKITASYMWLPVKREAACRKLHFYIGNEKVNEIDICLDGTDCEFYACWDVSAYIGQSMEVRIDGLDTETLDNIFCYPERPQNVYPFRPKIHFAPEVGWHNDPNGLVYQDGVYHLYYQWNPYGVEWGNMHWGHAVSRDLLHWENRGLAMSPDETGTVYSGCAICDKDGVAGLGKNVLLYYYTAAGGRNEWSRNAGNLFTQRLAWSDDGGETLQTTDRFRMENIINENRDPKVFYHAPTRAYIMVLYLDENEFAIYRSDNLLDWEEMQRFGFPGMWECPDLFELKVEKDRKEKLEESGQTESQKEAEKQTEAEYKWVFWSADGYYVIGDFDGYKFTAQSEVQSAYCSKIPYAAQSFSGIDGRTISVAWLRLKNTRGNYCGQMSIPAELSLKKIGNGYRICFAPVSNQMAEHRLICESGSTSRMRIPCDGKPLQLDLAWKANRTGRISMDIQNVEMIVDFETARLIFRDSSNGRESVNTAIEKAENGNISLILDQETIEFFADDGTIYGVVETGENVLGQSVFLQVEATDVDVSAYTLQ